MRWSSEGADTRAPEPCKTTVSQRPPCPAVPTSSACSSSDRVRLSSGRRASSTTPGTQACKALRSEGLEVVLMNSNPATIMTDPDVADRTYVEPLTREYARSVIEKEKPDALLPTVGGQTALNLAMELGEQGVLEELGVKLIGASLDAIRVAEDRLAFRGAMESIGIEVPGQRLRAVLRGRIEAGRPVRLPGGDPAVVHAGRRRRRHRLQHGGVPRAGAPRHRAEPGARGADRGVGHRLEGVRARGDARRGGQLRRHLPDREHRSDGGAHRRQHHRRPRHDPHRQGIPADARRRAPHHQPGGGRDRRLEHPVRGPTRTPAGWSRSR